MAVQGRRGRQDLHGLVPADQRSVVWELECALALPPPDNDLRGLQIHGSPGKRFVYISWGVVDRSDVFTTSRRAKLWLDAVPADVMAKACASGLLVGRLGLKDEKGWPVCAAVRPPRIQWSA